MTDQQPDLRPPSSENSPSSQPDQVIKMLLMSVLTLGLVAAIGIPLWLAKQRSNAESRQLSEFSLTDRFGETITRSDLANKRLVVNFVFSGCSLSCRAVYDQMAEIEQLVENDPTVRLVSLTIDPRTDTPDVLDRFAAKYTDNGKNWHFLTGEKADLFPLIEESFLRRSQKLEGLVPGGFEDIHLIFVVDTEGTIHRSFNGLQPGVAAEVVSALKRL